MIGINERCATFGCIIHFIFYRIMSEDDSKQKYKLPFLSKKRFVAISDQIHSILDDNDKVEAILKIICSETNFDPSSKQYTPEQGKRDRENRKKRANELGISLYEASGRKAAYERQKAKKTYIKKM